MGSISRAIFPGSFDPLTFGHVDIITRALELVDEVIVGVLANPSKTPMFSTEDRVEIIRKHFAESDLDFDEGRLRVESFSGLLVDFAKVNNTRVIVRGLRATSDFDYEAQMALMNKQLSPEIETCFLMTREKYSYISSSLVRQVAPLGGSVSHLVPPAVEQALKAQGE